MTSFYSGSSAGAMLSSSTNHPSVTHSILRAAAEQSVWSSIAPSPEKAGVNEELARMRADALRTAELGLVDVTKDVAAGEERQRARRSGRDRDGGAARSNGGDGGSSSDDEDGAGAPSPSHQRSRSAWEPLPRRQPPRSRAEAARPGYRPMDAARASLMRIEESVASSEFDQRRQYISTLLSENYHPPASSTRAAVPPPAPPVDAPLYGAAGATAFVGGAPAFGASAMGAAAGGYPYAPMYGAPLPPAPLSATWLPRPMAPAAHVPVAEAGYSLAAADYGRRGHSHHSIHGHSRTRVLDDSIHTRARRLAVLLVPDIGMLDAAVGKGSAAGSALASTELARIEAEAAERRHLETLRLEHERLRLAAETVALQNARDAQGRAAQAVTAAMLEETEARVLEAVAAHDRTRSFSNSHSGDGGFFDRGSPQRSSPARSQQRRPRRESRDSKAGNEDMLSQMRQMQDKIDSLERQTQGQEEEREREAQSAEEYRRRAQRKAAEAAQHDAQWDEKAANLSGLVHETEKQAEAVLRAAKAERAPAAAAAERADDLWEEDVAVARLGVPREGLRQARSPTGSGEPGGQGSAGAEHGLKPQQLRSSRLSRGHEYGYNHQIVRSERFVNAAISHRGFKLLEVEVDKAGTKKSLKHARGFLAHEAGEAPLLVPPVACLCARAR